MLDWTNATTCKAVKDKIFTHDNGSLKLSPVEKYFLTRVQDTECRRIKTFFFINVNVKKESQFLFLYVYHFRKVILLFFNFQNINLIFTLCQRVLSAGKLCK